MSVDKAAKRKDHIEWKKQIIRFRQLAVQGLGRSVGTSVLSDNIQELEGGLDDVKAMCQTTKKHLLACLSGNVGSDFERRLKKLPLSHFANSLFDLKPLILFETLSKTLLTCAEVEDRLARESVNFEINIENNFIQAMQTISEVDIPAIVRLRRQLHNLTLDMDAVKTKLMKQPVKGISSVKGSEELEDAELKVEQCKDEFSAALFSFMAREEEFCRHFLSLAKMQADYHRQSLKLLEQTLPSLTEEIEHRATRPVFGQSLELHLIQTGREISIVIEGCINILHQVALDEEGVFRVAGGSRRVKKLKAAFDANMVNLDEYQHDIHCVADVLKQYLRNLPVPLMTFDLYDDWLAVSQLQGNAKRDEVLRIVQELPRPNYNNLRYLMRFLQKLADRSNVNRMSASNLAIVIGPNLLWPEDEEASNFQIATQAIEMLIANAEYFFPGDVNFTSFSLSADNSPCPVRHQLATTTPSSTQPAKVDVSLNGSDTGNVSRDTSPKAIRQVYRKAPAPPPPSSTNHHTPSLPLPAAVKVSTNHRQVHSTNESDAVVMPHERPSVPPPAPPRKLDKSNVVNKGDLPAGQKRVPPSTENRPSGHVTGGTKQAVAVAGAVVGCVETGDGTASENFDLPVDYDTSGVFETAEHSWGSETDEPSGSATAEQPKEDIRKMTAQLKAQWWQTPTPADRTTEISGKFNPRVSPSEPSYDQLDVRLENKGSENDVCVAVLETSDPQSEDLDNKPETMDRKSDTVEDNTDGHCRIAEDKLEDIDEHELSTDSRTHNSESENLEAEVSKKVPRTPPTASPRSSVATGHETEPVVTESLEQAVVSTAPLSSETTACTSALSPPPTHPRAIRYSDDCEPGPVSVESSRGKELFTQAPLSVETPTTAGPLTRPKPMKSPPERPLPISHPTEVHSEAGPPSLPRKLLVDGKSLGPDNSELSATTPSQSDVRQKHRTQDKGRPEKPPPPLPKSFRSQKSEPAAKSATVMNSRDDVTNDKEVAVHNEYTHL